MSVAIGWDDLWLEVKCQSSSEIAGSPRKVFRDRVQTKYVRGKATGWCIEGNRDTPTKLRILTFVLGRQSHGAKLVRQKGNNPDSRLRSLSLD